MTRRDIEKLIEEKLHEIFDEDDKIREEVRNLVRDELGDPLISRRNTLKFSGLAGILGLSSYFSDPKKHSKTVDSKQIRPINWINSLNIKKGIANNWFTNIRDEILFTNDGAWTWFNGPSAIHKNGTTYVAWVNSLGDIKIGSYNHSTNSYQTNTLHFRFEQDDHDGPGIRILDNGKLIVF